jgi:hypothetical protein
MDAFFVWLESTGPSVWVRESPSLFAFPGILALHTVGMAFLVGTSMAISLRTLGAASRLAPRSLLGFVPVMWLGLFLNAFSGVILLAAYPTKALTNPVFYLKLFLIGLALIGVRYMIRHYLKNAGADIAPGPAPPITARTVAALTILLWAGAITSGRFLAYTYTRLLATGFL